ncbi:hypothetical protein J437_LFUL002479 [Ladona fulva]|uniref:C2H2-type domain-containing protein n=1 Tax=Ladona fulva TaxID=123851 RepID=A0A8K0JSK4_LADFU|nr:hypothetical protein J437_LFUL002479 [Ladona fulva]
MKIMPLCCWSKTGQGKRHQDRVISENVALPLSVPDHTLLYPLSASPNPPPGPPTPIWYLPIGLQRCGRTSATGSNKGGESGEVAFGRGCEQCGRHFTHASTYKRHIKYVHGAHRDSKCVCNICGADLCRPDNLLRHKKLSHREFSGNVLAVVCVVQS